MSWSRETTVFSRKGLIGGRVIATLLLTTLTLTGCGFRPLYEDRATPGSVPSELSHIEVSKIDGRVGVELRNTLIDRFSARDSGQRAKYRLDIRLGQRKEGLAIQQDESVTRFNYKLLGSFNLVDVEHNTIVLSDSAQSSAAFNVIQSEFATLSAERNAEDRAARDLAGEITTRIALYFKRARPS